ncbi:MAG: hypothetical protein VW417_09140, partial [Alphaproteobacteria bacterium]
EYAVQPGTGRAGRKNAAAPLNKCARDFCIFKKSARLAFAFTGQLSYINSSRAFSTFLPECFQICRYIR